MSVRLPICFVALALTLTACTEKSLPNLPVNLTPASALQDPNASDLVIVVTNVAVNGLILDTDNNGNPDQFSFPTACGTQLPAGCGYSLASAATAKLGSLPLNFRYQVDIRVRDSVGTILTQGSTTFDNLGTETSIDIALSAPPATP